MEKMNNGEEKGFAAASEGKIPDPVNWAENFVNQQAESGEEPKVVNISQNAKDGQTKCPKCGSTDIQTNAKTGKLRCNFCRHEFEPKPVNIGSGDDIFQLEGITLHSGAQNIAADANDVVTLKCESCGAEVVIDTASVLQARCHWCRNTLSINQQIANGAVPDVVLPFSVPKADAQAEIEKFVNKRKFFAHPKFTKEFTTENVNGVYLPYMIVDVNAHAHFSGTAEVQVREYTVGEGDDKETRYDADAYHVEREFDVAINDLTVESSSDKLDTVNQGNTNNVINAVMPFDTENCVLYDANYLKGYTSEKRNVDVDALQPMVKNQSLDVSKFAAKESMTQYDRGVRWDGESINVKGQSWTSAYLPVWLYSYLQVKGNQNLLHYVAVNARTKETMGSVPINKIKLTITSILIEIFGAALAILIGFWQTASDSDASNLRWLLLLSGVVFYGAMYMRYRNADARHTYEVETQRTVADLREVDEFREHRTGLDNSRIEGENGDTLHSASNPMETDTVLQALGKKGVSLSDLQDVVSKFNDR